MTSAGGTAPRAARLLLVDDDEAACRLLSEVLEREAYRVVSALSADEAIAKLDEEGPFDAVLTDLRMPRKSGLDLSAPGAGTGPGGPGTGAHGLRRCRRGRRGDPGRRL